MTLQLQQVIDTVRTLSLRDKLELLEFISHDLQKSYNLAKESPAFWSPRSIDEIARAQNAPVVTDIHTLAVDFWPEDESADDINEFVSEQRRADRAREI